jgi:uncharacterized protein
MRCAKLFLCLGLTLVMPASSWGLDDAYSDQIMVADRSYSTRVKAFQSALTHVLIRISGNVHAAGPLKDEVDHAEKKVQRFYYQSDKDRDSIIVSFDPLSIRDSLRSAGQAIWPEKRSTFVFWVLDARDSPQWLSSESKAIAALHDRSHLRGLPVVRPLLDLEEQAMAKQLMVSSALDDFLALRIASERYAADDIVFSAIKKNIKTQIFHVSWRWLGKDNQRKHWIRTGENLETLMQDGVDHISDDLASHQASLQDVAMASHILMHIDDVPSLLRMIALFRFLGRSELVDAYHFVSIAPSFVDMDIKLKSDEKSFLQLLSEHCPFLHLVSQELLPQDDDQQLNQLNVKWVEDAGSSA